MHPGLQLGDVAAQLADPQLRPRQVAEHRDLAPDPLGGGADRLDRLRVALAVGVGEVEAEDVGAGLDQLLEDRRRPSSPGPTVAMIFVRRPATLLVGVIFACTFMTVESARLPQNVTPICVTLI